MPTDERPAAQPVPLGFREWLVAMLRSRVPWMPAASTERSLVRVRLAKAVAIIFVGAMVVGAWLVLRPASHPNIATLLPRAGAAPTADGAADTPNAAEVSGATGSAVIALGSATTGASGTSGAPGTGSLLVHVVGAVVAPGVVRVPSGARVLDAVAAAGGATADANLAGVNLAAKLSDGQRVAVPRIGETAPAVVADGGASDGGANVEPAGPVDLNNATAAQLDTLPGVGPATAAAIIAYRTQHGPFRTVEALGDVKGIGAARLEQLRPLVTV